MFELLALLLPIAAASGWYVARRHYAADRRFRRVRDLNASYTRGLEYMLQDRVDEALDLLSETAATDIEGRELRLAIGNFFRRRGEVDKALAVHEALLAHAGLTEPFRSRVQLELGTDYSAAGLLDRAEGIFLSLQERPDFSTRSLESLLKIYQRERDWEKAIDCLKRLRRSQKPAYHETVAQFYCELADQQRDAGRDDDALGLTQAALRDDPHCARALLLRAGLLAKRREWSELRAVLTTLERHAPAFLAEILDLGVLLYAERQDEGGLLDWLAHLDRDCGCSEAAVLLSERLAAQNNVAAATDYVLSAITGSPSVPLTRKLLDLLNQSSTEERLAALPRIVHTLHSVLPPRTRRYRCSQCGFTGSEIYWRCPSCQYWETIKPAAE